MVDDDSGCKKSKHVKALAARIWIPTSVDHSSVVMFKPFLADR